MAGADKNVLFIDDEEGMCGMVTAVLGDLGYNVTSYTDPVKAIKEFVPQKYGVAITDVKMPGMDGLTVLERLRSADPTIPVIMITAYATVDTSIQALRKGAYDMLTKPFEPDELIHRVKNALRQTELVNENKELKEQIGKPKKLIGESEQLKALLETAEKVAKRDMPILITGESGTGKELVARQIHEWSPRAGSKFVAINCGALPSTLLESELFGAKKGAYTGANEERDGLIQNADGGTLFLDEVGNLPLNVQKLLLRFLQEKEFYRLGDTTPIKVDVRIVAATNADLGKEVTAGNFREDLYYRLAVGRLKLPPLRERTTDIPLLVNHFVHEQNQKFGTHIQGVSPEALRFLIAQPWPGNVRQLKNVVDAAVALEPGDLITTEAILPFVEGGENLPTPEGFTDYTSSLEKFEAEYFVCLLDKHNWNVEAAANAADINMATLYRKIKKYALKQGACKPGV